jgi:hypothetical protein
MAAFPASQIHASRVPNRFVQLSAGIIAFLTSEDLQHAWILFTKPIQVLLHVSLTAARRTFSGFLAHGERAETISNLYFWYGVKFKEMHP